MDVARYLDQVRAKFASGQATEHSYRPALQALFESIDPGLTVINEPKRSDTGMPDFLFRRGDVPVGWVEAKDVDKDVIKLKGYSVEQRQRYEKAYPNLIYTNGVDFEFIREGEGVHFVSIADFLMGLQPKPDQFEILERQLQNFAGQKPISIRSAKKLAEIMAAKAAIIKDEVGLALRDDPEFRSGLGGQFRSFKANLLPALEPGEFADIYAETITYGLFAARFHDDTLDTFSRAEALEKLPASNPFLKGLFEYIAGPALPKRLTYIVDDLVAVMRASDPHSLFENYGKFTARNDPFVHFYEDFLAAYNPKKRKSRGVWYTPEPVVDFIVRAVDDVLKTEFDLPDGLADTSKVTVDWDTGTNHPKTGKPVTEKREVHKVQILDPATGTGTFLAKALQLIADRVKARAPGKWSGYVEQDLLPRLHGFELLMASYAMCHMKLDMQLTESGYRPSANPPRLSVWLTNSLEPASKERRAPQMFMPLVNEAEGADEVKRQSPIMCVIGNPPYSGESANKGDHIMRLMESYKTEPGGKERLSERNPKWLNDDYVKFIRLAEDMIARSPSGGVLGFITNHGYLDNPTFRGMRWHLLTSFDKIWIIDLHGNTIKNEQSPDGQKDINVFDITPGVALIIAVKSSFENNGLATVNHSELWGSRASKYAALSSGSLSLSNFEPVFLAHPSYTYFSRNEEIRSRYEEGFSVAELMPRNSIGIVTARDALTVDLEKGVLWDRVIQFAGMEIEVARQTFNLGKDARDWSVVNAREDVGASLNAGNLTKISYRPFDTRWTYYTGQSRGFHCYPRDGVMRNFVRGFTPGLVFRRQQPDANDLYVFITSEITADGYIRSDNKGGESIAPLYEYMSADGAGRILNLDPKLYAAICAAAGIDPADQAGPEDDFRNLTGDARPSEIKVFDYIYGVLHAPNYRETFAEFLKIDFPRIPYPPSPAVFAHVSAKGERLRRLHLMEPAAIGDTPYTFVGDGKEVVAPGHPKGQSPSPARGGGGEADGGGGPQPTRSGIDPSTTDVPSANPLPVNGGDLGRVHINPYQYFDGVPAVAWTFHIGGYQPAQKWLKDRRGRSLSYDDIGHYQRIVKILCETDRIMREIDLPLDT